MALEFKNVSRFFETPSGQFEALRGIDFKVEEGEFLSIVGPSGCGKSTVLAIAAGIDKATKGDAFIGGIPVTGPSERVAFMLQKDLLLPWRSIIKNIEFGLEARNVNKIERRLRAEQELKACNLDGFDDHFPYQLSGGMRQRAALARTLAIDPEIILLDEPFSALDAQTRLLLQDNFAKIIKSTNKTTLLITHELTEAVVMSDRVLVMSERPGSIIAEINIDFPHRGEPLKRRKMPKVSQYVAELFDLLKLEEMEVN